MNKEKTEPKLDYWMIPLLKKSINTQMQKETSKHSSHPEYIQKAINDKNEWNPIGQLEIIRIRLNNLQLFYDNEIKRGLEESN